MERGAARKELPTLPQVIDRIGFGIAQVRAVLLGGGVWLADGAELLLISTVTQGVSDEWDLGPYDRGAIVTIVFIGILVGNLLSGPIGDSLGRRHLIIASYMGILTFSVISSYAPSYRFLSIVRLFVGMSFGLGQPAWAALGSELTPTAWRVLMSSLGMSMFSVGEMYSALIIYCDDPEMENLDWRWLLRMGSIPSFLFGVSCFFLLQQSPSYLALHGEPEAAKGVLKSMREQNSAGDISVDFRVVEPVSSDESLWAQTLRQLGIVFSRSMIVSTTIVVYSCFVLNLCFYGSLYAFPQVLPNVEMSGTPALELLIGAAAEIPGSILGIVIGTMMRRKAAMRLYGVLMISAILSFVVGASFGTDGSWAMLALLHYGYYGIKAYVIIGFAVVYQYSTEIYPTEARITGTAINIAGGRIAGMVAPLAFEFLYSQTDEFGAFFYCMAILLALNIVLIDFLPLETAGALLSDRLDVKYGSVGGEDI